MQRAPPKTDITTLPLKPTNKPTESRPIPNAKSFFTRSFAGMTKGGANPPRVDGLPRPVAAPSVIPAKAGIQGGKGRGLGVRLGPSSQAARPYGIPAFAGMTERGRIRLEPMASLGPSLRSRAEGAPRNARRPLDRRRHDVPVRSANETPHSIGRLSRTSRKARQGNEEGAASRRMSRRSASRAKSRRIAPGAPGGGVGSPSTSISRPPAFPVVIRRPGRDGAA